MSTLALVRRTETNGVSANSRLTQLRARLLIEPQLVHLVAVAQHHLWLVNSAWQVERDIDTGHEVHPQPLGKYPWHRPNGFHR